MLLSRRSSGDSDQIVHLQGDFDVRVPVDLTAYTTIPIWSRNRVLNLVLVLMLLPDEKYGMSPENLGFDMHRECLARIIEIGKEIRGSQLLSLTVLSEIAAQIIEHGLHDAILSSEELASMSMGVLRALHLSSDPRAALVIPSLTYRIRKVKDLMYHRNYRPEENLAADKEANIAVNKLMIYLASMRIFGGRNTHILSCSQTRRVTALQLDGWQCSRIRPRNDTRCLVVMQSSAAILHEDCNSGGGNFESDM